MSENKQRFQLTTRLPVFISIHSIDWRAKVVSYVQPHLGVEDHVVAGVVPAQHGGGHAAAGRRELGGLALAPPVGVGVGVGGGEGRADGEPVQVQPEPAHAGAALADLGGAGGARPAAAGEVRVVGGHRGPAAEAEGAAHPEPAGAAAGG